MKEIILVASITFIFSCQRSKVRDDDSPPCAFVVGIHPELSNKLCGIIEINQEIIEGNFTIVYLRIENDTVNIWLSNFIPLTDSGLYLQEGIFLYDSIPVLFEGDSSSTDIISNIELLEPSVKLFNLGAIHDGSESEIIKYQYLFVENKLINI